MSERPELSVVLATTHPWPEAERTLRALLAAEGADMEVIVGAVPGGEPPAGWGDERLRGVVGEPGESVFALRSRGLAAARGEIVAITEDHCVPAPDWPGALIAAHARHPEAAALAGAVGNGAVDDAWDWANFLMTFAEHMPPLDDAPAGRAPSVANGSLKRSLVSLPAAPAAGWLELELMPDLVGAGRVARDGGPVVVHDQTHAGWRGTLSAHFHNGRASAGLRVARPGWGTLRAEWRRVAGLPRRLARELRAALAVRPPLAGTAARGARLVPLLGAAHAAGEAVGLLRGPGASAEQLD